MLFRLLIDFELIELVRKLPSDQRQRLYAHFRKIQEFPGHYSDFIETDAEGRRLDISFFENLLIPYWTDGADRQVKILGITRRRC